MKRYFTERKGENENLYTDLAVERRRVDTDVRGVEYKSSECEVGVWEDIRIYSEEGARALGRPTGNYSTLNIGRMDLICEDEIEEVSEAVSKKLCEMVDSLGIIPERILVAGLGNRNLTPDSVGPKTAEIVKPTLHIKEMDEETFYTLGCSEIAVITPSVSALSGLDSAEVVKGVARRIIPDVILAVDAIATRSVERLGTTVQISDTGIFPGSGVGNSRGAVNEVTMGAPTIAIGVPTVIDFRCFENGRKSDTAMLVAPKEIDEITSIAARIIGGAINQAFGISPY